jgi:hypothetical protein
MIILEQLLYSAETKLFRDKNMDTHRFIYRGCAEVHNAWW